MEIMAFTGSAILFALFAVVVLFVLINMSSRLAMIILFIIPVLSVLVIPDTAIAFLSYRQMLLANGLVPINNFHILLIIWSTLIGIILYTEFLTWYLAKGRHVREKKTAENRSNKTSGSIQKNLFSVFEKTKKSLLRRN